MNILWMSWRWDCWSMSNPHTQCLSTFVATVILSGSGRSLQKYRQPSRGKVCMSFSSCIRRIPIFPPSSFLPRKVNFQCLLFHLKIQYLLNLSPLDLDWLEEGNNCSITVIMIVRFTQDNNILGWGMNQEGKTCLR